MTPEERAYEITMFWCGGQPEKDGFAKDIAAAICAAMTEAVAPMACGHPRACLVQADEGTAHCAWCESLAREREACAAEAERFTPRPAPTAAHQAAADLVRSIAAAIRARGRDE